MKIKVKLFSYLCNLTGREENPYSFNMEMGKGAMSIDLLRAINLQADIPMIILINGVVKEKNYILQENDEVSILPFIEGG